MVHVFLWLQCALFLIWDSIGSLLSLICPRFQRNQVCSRCESRVDPEKLQVTQMKTNSFVLINDSAAEQLALPPSMSLQSDTFSSKGDILSGFINADP